MKEVYYICNALSRRTEGLGPQMSWQPEQKTGANSYLSQLLRIDEAAVIFYHVRTHPTLLLYRAFFKNE